MHEGAYFTYILASRSHTLYIGITGDLRKRVFQHKWKNTKVSPRAITAIASFGSSRIRMCVEPSVARRLSKSGAVRKRSSSLNP